MAEERRFACEICGRPIEPGDRIRCNDGYERLLGEFVLVERDGLHEDNWPAAHSACELDHRAPARGGATLPTARLLRRR